MKKEKFIKAISAIVEEKVAEKMEALKPVTGSEQLNMLFDELIDAKTPEEQPDNSVKSILERLHSLENKDNKENK